MQRTVPVYSRPSRVRCQPRPQLSRLQESSSLQLNFCRSYHFRVAGQQLIAHGLPAAPEHAALRQTVLDIYTPAYGEGWETEFLDAESPVYARIDADRMFTFHMPAS